MGEWTRPLPLVQTADMRVAAVQAAPVYRNREATIELVVERISEAADGGADSPDTPLWDYGPLADQ